MDDKKHLDTSSAYQANLPEFASAPEEFPEPAGKLLSALENFLGIQERLGLFFRELYHPFPDPAVVVREYRNFALGDTWALHKTENSSELILITLELGLAQLSMGFPHAERERVLGTVLELFAREIGSGVLWDDHKLRLIDDMMNLLREERLFAGRASGRMKNLYRAYIVPEVQEQGKKLLDLCLSHSLDTWSRETNSRWVESYKCIACFGEMEAFFDRIDGHRARLGTDTEIPDYETIARELLTAVRADRDLLPKTEWLLALFDLPPMQFYQAELLNHLTPMLRKARLHDDKPLALELFNLLFPFFHRLGFGHHAVINSILLHLGKQIIPSGNHEIIDAFCHHILALPFPDPEITGVNKDWQLQKNPAHLPTIRTLLEIIKIDPDRTSDLLAGLHINLRLGGVFISDTDLFHTDVSELLNSNVKPVYKQLKQVCRLFPVYFRDIGAEGDLRIVSTRVDELHSREDKLIHFLRKQIHIESNNTQLDLLRAILVYWYTGDSAPLVPMIPEDVRHFLDHDEKFLPAAHETMQVITQVLGVKTPAELLETNPDEIASLCEKGDLDVRVGWLVRIHQLLCAKYDLDAAGARDALTQLMIIDPARLRELFESIDSGQLETAVDNALDLMADLSKVIQDPTVSQGEERIYRKRHIAAGIPSMYGSYQEKKLECLGATYRLERLIAIIIEKLIASIDLDYITRPALRRIEWILERLIRALELDGIRVHDLRSHCDMLKSALLKEGFTINQFLNIFQVFSQSTRGIIDRYFYSFHKEALSVIMPVRAPDEENQARLAEMVMRDILSSAFGIGLLDSFLGRITSTLVDMRQKLNPETVDMVLSFDADKSFVRLHCIPENLASAVWIGNKGYFLHILRQLGIRVPWGFALTTEVYRCRAAFDSYSYMKAALRRRLLTEIQNLEELTGYTLGRCSNGRPPLLLSVRSGAAVSMPGVMMTFLNIGMNREITQELSRLPNYAWTAWDCYRRMIQLWGMAHGIDRDEFDRIMKRMKTEHDVDAKQKFSPDNMRAIADAYLELLATRNITIPEDPLEQVLEAIEMVFASWHSKMADVYRRQFDLAPEWGTAVLIQRMILGNLNFDSGTGVAIISSRGNKLSITGDFVPISQGEDVVSGLVHPYPISNAERLQRSAEMTLESDYPKHYEVIKRLGRNLIIDNDFPEQEIEFTFEDSNPENLYVLQCRTIVRGHGEDIAVFTDGDATPLTMGVGAGGGAFVGKAVFSREGIEELAQSGDLILVRPDTVPDDVDMIFRCQGLLTARGGITSHAAVTANRLGKVCVVNCRDLIVYDDEKRAVCGGIKIREGDDISIDGQTGKVFRGIRETVLTRSKNRPMQLG